jgi:predicted nucleotidyltransferase
MDNPKTGQLIATRPGGKICDFIDGAIPNDTPEEYVRQNSERRLISPIAKRNHDFMTQLYLTLQQEKQRILAIAERYHAHNLRVVGSVVRGEEREDSDIDLLVDFLPGATLLDQVGLMDALSKALGRKVDVVSERALNRHLRQSVMQEARPL